MKSCHFCGHENKDTAKFCVKCGKSLEKHCPKCNAEVGEEEIYCPQCGTRLDGKVNCPKCNAENDGTAAFCELCGAPLKALPVKKGRAPNPYSVRSQGVYARSSASAPVEKEPPKAAPKKRRICKSLLSRALDNYPCVLNYGVCPRHVHHVFHERCQDKYRRYGSRGHGYGHGSDHGTH